MNRSITTDFWMDAKVEEMSSTAKFVLLYLLTNPKTNLAGCYEVSYKRAGIDTGLNAKQVENAIAELSEANVIRHSAETNEVLILNWDRYNWTKSPKLDKPLVEKILEVKDGSFFAYLVGKYEQVRGREFPQMDTVSKKEDTVSIPNRYVSISKSIPISKPKSIPTSTGNDSLVDTGSQCEEIVSYLNERAGKDYRPTSESTMKLIRARLGEGFTVDDFKAVIDNKVASWLNDPKMDAYLRPSTLFQKSKFEAYLNERPRKAARNLDKYVD